MKHYDEVVSYLDARTNLGVKPGLERIEWLMNAMGRPDECAPAIHVTGTNGKTTTARLASILLQASGMRTGTYTSPHLERVNERIAVDCIELDDEAFETAFADVEPFIGLMERNLGEAATYFEIVTAMGFAAFAGAPVSVEVLEVGMGGTWDATNVANAEVAVVTNVALDHTEYLGTSVAAIAAEKAGIVKPDARVVLGWLPDEISAVFEARCADAGAESLIRAESDFDLTDRSIAHGGQVISVRGPSGNYRDLYLPLHGEHQARNAAIALAAAEILCGRELDPDCVAGAFAAVKSPGRIEVVNHNPLVILDGAHNPAGADALLSAIEEAFFYERMILVAGVFADKDVAGIVEAIAGEASVVLATETSSGRATSARDVAKAASDAGCEDVRIVKPVARAVEQAIDIAGPDDLVLVCGSLYVVGEARGGLVQA